MPMLTDLADACRKSGLPVEEIDGWRTRGHGSMLGVQTIAVHHTATSAKAPGNYPSLRIVRDGRPDLPGPLSQLGLGRDGKVYVIAAGVSYHAGATFENRQDNWHAIGIEAEHDGLSPWPQVQYDAYVRLCRALCDHYGLPTSRVEGHKEIATPRGRKTDPNFDMDAFRAHVASIEGDWFDMADKEDLRTVVREELDKVLADFGNRAVVDNPFEKDKSKTWRLNGVLNSLTRRTAK